MTIDEVISYEKLCSKRSDAFVGYTTEEHEQLAEWLEDYKRVKKWKDEIMEEFCRYDASSIEELMQRARNKAIDDMKSEWDKRFKNLIQWCKDGRLMGLRQADFIFDEIAQQLKEGESDV